LASLRLSPGRALWAIGSRVSAILDERTLGAMSWSLLGG
jgi:hypothetical protein